MLSRLGVSRGVEYMVIPGNTQPRNLWLRDGNSAIGVEYMVIPEESSGELEVWNRLWEV